MTTEASPAVLLVPGSWHGAWAYDDVCAGLAERGLAARAIDLPSNDGGGLADDAAAVRGALDEIGEPAVVVGHSYGGIAVSEGAAGAPQAIALVYLCAFMLDVGESLLDAMQHELPPWLAVDPEAGTCRPVARRGGPLRRLLRRAGARRGGPPRPAVARRARDAADGGGLARTSEQLPDLRPGSRRPAGRAGGHVRSRGYRRARALVPFALSLPPGRRRRPHRARGTAVRAVLACVATLVCLAAPSAARAADAVVTSFDGTPIVVHPYPLASGAPAPTVLMGPGWANRGAPADDPFVMAFQAQGYHVVTWDPRGFGASGGTVNIDDPAIEGRDTSAIVDWIAQQPWSQLDRPGDPRLGMAGGSYGAGIQYATAANDHRIDVLAPIVGWNSLGTALYKDATFKQGWVGLLYAAGKGAAENDGLAGGAAGVQTGGLDPHIGSAYESVATTGSVGAADLAWLRSKGPGTANVSRITAPTLIIGGTVDTLFPLDEDLKIYRTLVRRNVPAKLMWFCGGHGVCHTGSGDPAGPDDALLLLSSQHVTAAIEAWFAKYLKGDASASTGPGFEWLADDAKWRSARAYPPRAGTPITVKGRGRVRAGARDPAAARPPRPRPSGPAGPCRSRSASRAARRSSARRRCGSVYKGRADTATCASSPRSSTSGASSSSATRSRRSR